MNGTREHQLIGPVRGDVELYGVSVYLYSSVVLNFPLDATPHIKIDSELNHLTHKLFKQRQNIPLLGSLLSFSRGIRCGVTDFLVTNESLF
jgi:hypothetical protein